MSTKVVFCSAGPLLVVDVVMEEMSLKEGQRVTDDQMRTILELNLASIQALIGMYAGMDTTDSAS